MSIHLTSRRGFLRGLGAAVSLPAFEAFRPLMAANEATRALATTASGAPLRMAYLYVPNGVNLEKWRPDGTTSGYKMGGSFGEMEKHREDFQIFTGFEQKNASAGSDGAGDHARANSVFLTSARPKKPPAPTSSSAFPSIRSPRMPLRTRPVSHHLNSQPVACANPASAIPATPALTGSTCPGARKTNP